MADSIVKNDMKNISVQRTIEINNHKNLYGISGLFLLMRAIPLMVSIFLFIIAAVADIKIWGSGGIQMLLITGLIFGIVGVAIFIPNKRS